MWQRRRRDFHIFRFSVRSHRWVDAKTVVDRRPDTAADTLWDGRHLYVASHKQLRKNGRASLGPPSYLFRFSYSRRRHRYSLDAGFPTVVNHFRTETLVIDKDTTGRLWATWQRGRRGIYVASTTKRGRRWLKAFRLRFPQAVVTPDDISSLVAFSGRIGLMWSNQSRQHDGFWFSMHRDGSRRNAWQAPTAAWAGDRQADDHINLKSDSRGNVYAAVKTSAVGARPLALLLVRRPDGRWFRSVYGTARFCHNRPVLVIDDRRALVHMFATAPAPPKYRCTNTGGAIYEKSAAIDNAAFPYGRGSMVLNDSRRPFLHNASVSKREPPSRAGVLLLAVNAKTHRYWTLYMK